MPPESKASSSVARNTLAYWAYQIGDYALRFVVGVFLARSLGRELRGSLTIALLISNLGVAYAGFGLQAAATYFAGRRPDALARVHSLALRFVGVVLLADLALAGPFAETLRARVFGGIPWDFAAIPLAALPLTLYSSAAQGMLTGLGRVRRLSAILFGYSLAANLLNVVVLLVFRGRDETVVVALLNVWAATELGRAIALRLALGALPAAGSEADDGDGGSAKRTSPPLRLRDLFSFGLRAHAGGFAGVFVNKNDQTVVASLGSAAVGSYAISIRLAELLYHPSAALESGAYARIAASSREDAARLAQEMFRVNLVLTGGAMLAMALLAHPFVVFVYGAEFEDAALPLQILLPGTLAFALSRMLSLYFTARLGRPQIPAAAGWAGALLNLPLMYWTVVVRGWGLVGAAATTTFCYGAILAILLVAFARETGLRSPADYALPRARDLERLRRVVAAARRIARGARDAG